MATTTAAPKLKDVEAIVSARLIKKMESTGRAFWREPLHQGSFAPPKNFLTKNAYTGINVFLLWGGSGWYITKKQLLEYNRKNNTSFWFKAGTSMDTIVVMRESKKEISQEEATRLINAGKKRFVRQDGDTFYQVFVGLLYYEVIDCSLLFDKAGNQLYTPPQATTPRIADHDGAENLMARYMSATGVQRFETNRIPRYREATDAIYLLPKERYTSAEGYYRTAFHELIHSTGIPTRLNRPEFQAYSQHKQRSREEFVAEVGSMFIAGLVGYDADSEDGDNAENYVKGWCAWFKDNPMEMVRGLTEASKAVEYFQEQAKRGSVPATQPAQAPQAPPVAQGAVPQTREEWIGYLTMKAKNNNERAVRTYARIVKANKAEELKKLFKNKVTMAGNTPIYTLAMPNKTTIDVGMSFAVYTDAEGRAKPLFTLDGEDTIESLQHLVKLFKHEGFAKLVSYMDLRKAIK